MKRVLHFYHRNRIKTKTGNMTEWKATEEIIPDIVSKWAEPKAKCRTWTAAAQKKLLSDSEYTSLNIQFENIFQRPQSVCGQATNLNQLGHLINNNSTAQKMIFHSVRLIMYLINANVLFFFSHFFPLCSFKQMQSIKLQYLWVWN